jgi:hypothetical protein
MSALAMMPSLIFCGKLAQHNRVYRYLSFPIDRTNSGVETLGQSAGEFGGLAVFRYLTCSGQQGSRTKVKAS